MWNVFSHARRGGTTFADNTVRHSSARPRSRPTSLSSTDNTFIGVASICTTSRRTEVCRNNTFRRRHRRCDSAGPRRIVVSGNNIHRTSDWPGVFLGVRRPALSISSICSRTTTAAGIVNCLAKLRAPAISTVTGNTFTRNGHGSAQLGGLGRPDASLTVCTWKSRRSTRSPSQGNTAKDNAAFGIDAGGVQRGRRRRELLDR